MSDSLAVRLGRQVAAARYRSRQSQRELAEQCGLSQSRLSRIEMGKGVTFDDIEALAAALKVPVSTLVRGAEGGPPRTAIQRRPLGLLQQAVGRLQRELERFSEGVSDTESHFDRMVFMEQRKAALLAGARDLLSAAGLVADDFQQRAELEAGPALGSRRRRAA